MSPLKTNKFKIPPIKHSQLTEVFSKQSKQLNTKFILLYSINLDFEDLMDKTIVDSISPDFMIQAKYK